MREARRRAMARRSDLAASRLMPTTRLRHPCFAGHHPIAWPGGGPAMRGEGGAGHQAAHVPDLIRDLRRRKKRSRIRSGTVPRFAIGIARWSVLLPCHPLAGPAVAAFPAPPIHPFEQVFAPTSRSQTLSPSGYPNRAPRGESHPLASAPWTCRGQPEKTSQMCEKSVDLPPLDTSVCMG